MLPFCEAVDINEIIESVESFVRLDLPIIVSSTQLAEENKTNFFGSFEHNPGNFYFGEHDKLLIKRFLSI